MTSSPKTKPELLAPAGSVEAFYAAIESGADAIYCGTKQFNARLRAKNFALDDLARLIAVARAAGRKVYVTLNTLIKEEELPASVELLAGLRAIGPDALIIQDLGVYRLARRIAPEIPLHASTQMTIHNLDGALQAHRMGFARTILAREVTLDEIRGIRGGSEIQLETFIHGAMCYSVSGQCYFSSYAHGRSANRGLCMQPCRRQYEDLRFTIDDLRLAHPGTENEQRDPHGETADRQSSVVNRQSSMRQHESSIVNRQSSIFSPPDLCAAPIIGRLIAAGIHSFKIEGRLKPAESVAQTVSAYRMLIDAYPRITKEIMEEAQARLKMALGRRATTGFFLSAAGSGAGTGAGEGADAGGDSLQTTKSPNGESSLDAQSGRFLGRSLRWSPQGHGAFLLAASEMVKAGDSLRIQTRKGAAPRVLTIKKMFLGPKRVARAGSGQEVWIEAPFGVPVGSKVMKVRDADAAAQEDKRKVEEKWRHAGEQIQPEFDARRASSASAKSAVKIIQHPLSLSPATSQKLAAFPAERLIQVASLDDLQIRRAGIRGQAEEGRTEQGHGGGGTALILPLSEVERDGFEDRVGIVSAIGGIILELPQISFDEQGRREKIFTALERAAQLGARRFMVSNLAHFNLLRRIKRHGFFVIAGPLSGCLNSESLAQLEEMGVSLIAYSIEGDAQSLERLVARVGAERVAVMVYGKIPLFRSRQPWPEAAPNQGNRAGKRRREILALEPRDDLWLERREGLTWVVPARDFSLLRRLDWLRGIGVRRFIYDLRWATNVPQRIADIASGKFTVSTSIETMANFERGLA